MRKLAFISALLTVTLLANNMAVAFETDQYNLPPAPLADIGEEVSEYVTSVLAEAVSNVNSEISERERCISSPETTGCGGDEKVKARLAFLRSDEAVARTLADKLAGGRLMTTRFGKWIGSHKFERQPDRYKPAFRESIYLLNPANYLTMTPTVRLYGHEFGIDKLEHLFQQGWQYYEIYLKELAKGADHQHATQAAIEWGKNTERTYYGLLTSGVFSNADLAANYVGLRFYQGLARSIKVGDRERPPLLTLSDGSWQFTDPKTSGKRLLEPFLSDHLNEAWNPSAFRFTLYSSVRRSVRSHACPKWAAAYPGLGPDKILARSAALEMWNGESYGFTKKDRVVSIADACFDRLRH